MQTHYRRVSRFLVTAILLGTFPLAGADQGAPGFDDADLLFIPLRWCAVQGSPAVTNPAGAVPAGVAPTTTNVLLQRQTRASDTIWVPGANTSFRSAFPASTPAADAIFPVIADPKPPVPGQNIAGQGSANGGAGAQLGDIDECITYPSTPVTPTCELQLALDACRAAWDAKATTLGVPLVGPLALNFRAFVGQSSGTLRSTTGKGNWSTQQTVGPSFCTSTWNITTANYSNRAYIAVTDNQTNPSTAEKTVGHELGHMLFLAHGNGVDDDGDTFSESCDGVWGSSYTTVSPIESTSSAGSSLMVSSPNTSTLITAHQKFIARKMGIKIPGATFDPPGLLLNGDVVGATQGDAAGDVADPAADLVAAEITENAAKLTTSIGFGLAGSIPDTGHFQYVALIDLDYNPSTGGPPPALGFPQSKSFTGADLVVSVAVINGTASHRVWGFRSGEFRPIHDPRIRVEFTESGGTGEEEAPVVQSNGLALLIPNDVRGPKAPMVRLQAYARNTAHPQIDALSDRAGGASLSLTPPRFARAGVTPLEVQLCDPLDMPPCLDPEVTVEAAELVPHEMAQVFLGGTKVGQRLVDGNGNLKLVFTVPADTTPGPRLVSVNVQAVTAQVVLEVLPPDEDE